MDQQEGYGGAPRLGAPLSHMGESTSRVGTRGVLVSTLAWGFTGNPFTAATLRVKQPVTQEPTVRASWRAS